MSTAKSYGKQAPPNHSKRNLAIGVIIIAAVAALIIWNNFFRDNTNVTAAKIGEQTFDATEVNYYYAQVYNNTVQMSSLYTQLGMPGYDTNLSAKEQIYDEESGKTYEDYFRETALSSMQEIVALKAEAAKAGYTLSQEGRDNVDAQIKAIEDGLMQYTIKYGGREAYYLQASYGKGMTKGKLKAILTDVILAEEYAKARAQEFTYDDATIDQYYQENKADLDSYDFHTFFVAANPEAGTNEDGTPAEPTEEQKTAAMKTARDTANAMAAKVRGGQDFLIAAQNAAPEEDKADYVDGYTLTSDALGSKVSGAYASWVKDAGRRAGEITVVEDGTNGCYVVQFVAREKRDASLETVDVNSILFTAEVTETTDADGKTTSAPTEEQLAAAKTSADAMLAQWKASTDQSAEAFLALAPSSSNEKDPQASKHEALARNTFGTDFDKWAFTPGAVKVGDTALVEATDQSGAVIGYRLVQITALGQSRWLYTAENALRTKDYDAWFEEIKPNYPITQEEAGMKLVGPMT